MAHRDGEPVALYPFRRRDPLTEDLSAPYKRGVQPTWVKVKNPNYSRQEALGFR